MENDEFVSVNRATWGDKVDAHVVAYGAEEFAANPTALSSVVMRDAELMAPHLPESGIAGLTLLHLQCHIGTDTLSWARLGAEVTGLDFSPEAISVARLLAAKAGLAASFVESTVDGALQQVGDRFDVVYTSIGVVTWLPDLDVWAATIAGSLKPGGLFYVRDGHPLLYTVDYERDDELLAVTLPYFGTGEPQRSDDGLTYAVESEATQRTTYEWPHPISEIVQALLSAGLTLLSFQEHMDIPWRALPQMIEQDGGFVLPKGKERLPLTFSLAARRTL